jgi:hypothetical protein
VLIIGVSRGESFGVGLIGIVFLGFLFSIIQIRFTNQKLKPLREQLDRRELLFTFMALTRSTRPLGFRYSPLRGITRVELTLYEGYVRLRLPAPFRRMSSGRECIFTVSSARMRMLTVRFTPLKKRKCIIIYGKQIGHTLEQVIYSKNEVEEIWDHLLSIGVLALPS